MALTISLVEATPNRLRYLLTVAGGAGGANITSTGAATPDLLTDSLQGPIKKIAKVITDGYGTLASGAQTQAKSRALWLSDTTGANPASGTPAGAFPLVPTAICRITPRGATTAISDWSIEANVSGGNPILTATCGTATGTAYLDVFVPEAIG